MALGVNQGGSELLEMLGSIRRDPDVRDRMTEEPLGLRAESFTWLVVGALPSSRPRSLMALGSRLLGQSLRSLSWPLVRKLLGHRLRRKNNLNKKEEQPNLILLFFDFWILD